MLNPSSILLPSILLPPSSDLSLSLSLGKHVGASADGAATQDDDDGADWNSGKEGNGVWTRGVALLKRQGE